MIGEILEPIVKIVQNNSRFIGDNKSEVESLKQKFEEAVVIIQKNRK